VADEMSLPQGYARWCRTCGAGATDTQFRQCPRCGAEKCPTCDAGDDVECVNCEGSEE